MVAHQMTHSPIAADRTPEWFAARQTGLGASEAAAVCGLSPYDTPLDIWSRKTGRADGKESTPVMELGMLLEPDMFDAVARDEIVSQRAPGLFRHPDIPCVLASPDGILGDGRGLELKVTTDNNAELGSDPDELPASWLCQAQQQIATCNFPAVLFGVIILPGDLREWLLAHLGAVGTARVIGEAIRNGSIPLRFWNIDRHEKVISGILNRDVEFWKHVETDVPPEIDLEQSRACDSVKAAFRAVKESSLIDLSEADLETWSMRQGLKEQIKQFEKQTKRIDAELFLKIRESAGGRFPDGTAVKKVQVGKSFVPAYERAGYSFLKGSKK